MLLIKRHYTFVLKLLNLLNMTDTNFSSALYEKLSVADLIGDLQARMETIRPGISRNTILLAFKQAPTTPLRRRILEEAKIILENARQTEIEEAQPEMAT